MCLFRCGQAQLMELRRLWDEQTRKNADDRATLTVAREIEVRQLNWLSLSVPSYDLSFSPSRSWGSMD